MKLKVNDPPRAFEVGFEQKLVIKDCAHVELAPDEQITFLTESGAQYDVARKSWGFYATPSLNSRLPRFGLRAVLVKNRVNQYFIFLVEKGSEHLFQQYVETQPLRLVCWMDSAEALEVLDRSVNGGLS